MYSKQNTSVSLHKMETEQKLQSAQNGLLASEDTDDNRYYRFSGLRTMEDCKEISIQLAVHHYYSDENFRCRWQSTASFELTLHSMT